MTVDAPGCSDMHASVREEFLKIGKEVLMPSWASRDQAVPGRHTGAKDSDIDDMPLRPTSEYFAQSRTRPLVGSGQPDVVEPVFTHAMMRRVVAEFARCCCEVEIR